MLLKKIKTKGFLGHLANENNDFVELDFANKNLWLIQGRNGAGKSTLFDAITMAFFKQHRGGASNFANLIHDKADKSEIFVEFAFHGNDYRIAVDMPKKSTVTRRLQFWNGAEWETKNDDVDDWVSKNLKMKYDTFISSVLLRQGEADKFITAKPTPRREIFLELLQLEFYKRLTERAKHRQKCVGDRLKEIKQSLEGLNNPSMTEIKNQEKLVKQFRKELENLEKEKITKQKEFDNAKQAKNLKNEIEKIDVQQKRDAEFFENAAQVEEKYNYFVELKESLLRIENVWREKNEIARMEAETKTNEQKLADLNEELMTNTKNLDENLLAQESAKNELTELENKLASLKKDRDELKQMLDDIGRIENLESQIHQATETFQAVQKNVAEVVEKIAKLEKQTGEETEKKDALDTQLQKCNTDFQIWLDRLENRRKVIDKDECPTCGNELKREEIRQKLLADFEEAQQKVDELKQLQGSLRADFTKTKKQLSEINEELETETKKHQAVLKTEAALKAKIETCQSQITVSYMPAQREEIRNEFTSSENQIADLGNRFRAAQDKFENVREMVANLRNSKTRLESDLQHTRQNLENLQMRKQLTEAELTKTESQLSGKWKRHIALENEAELEILRQEKNVLRNVETKYKNLSDARNRKANLEGQKESFEKQFEEIPENHRREVVAVEKEFNEITEKIGVANTKLNDAENLCRKMSEDKAKYDEKSGELKSIQRDLDIWKTLTKTLGKDGLETKVVREAQHKIEGNANKTLQALSNGNFKLELTDSGKEMKIFVRDFTTGEQRQIEYFSGGEKFLTAISLAIAIGQSASGQNIANTLIIDEGFGALDDKNRGLMVNELTRLSEILENGVVIIVSHQDDVQENFANRYRLSKNEQGFINVEFET